ncbi:hypothetical protein LEP1GSC041_1156 [Leptospira noguchii str. 2006001870]|uniref:2Fe-2S iron-sulfur cluster-binding domain protein n=1 Tax=Leptospira noguchii serovar Autumnalis str. ZUN142 TaxID=1085540 RepID=M6UTJ7_9LEPT|nr:hypothetical protein LEP1GSC041_1156 [Leptospira noguchii str. 2006001870]EMO27684.1 hypothetical protein LEP1GSC170_5426 [Leptospira interrogans serovar Bataviae str. HAI135]EMO40588.1 hypothetical protein LEP1GSC186_4236 [Leptospira noguchii serovar Autumnalis str. ZUN142]
MDKCHCAQVAFETIVETARYEGVEYQKIIERVNAGNTCTACKSYLIDYCESRLQTTQTAAYGFSFFGSIAKSECLPS